MVVYSYTLYLANHYLDNSMPMHSTGAVQQVCGYRAEFWQGNTLMDYSSLIFGEENFSEFTVA